jgi:Spy/CpxP family protein refolding chaperone
MKMQRLKTQSPRRWRELALIGAAALALGGVAATGIAQTADGFRHARGHHGGAPEEMVSHLLQEAKDSLNLTSQQQLMWDNAITQTKSAHQSARTNREALKTVVQGELAKTAPDLAAIAATADNVEQQNRALRVQVRSQWLALYATFSADQKAVVRNLLQERIAKAEGFREKFKSMMKPAS